MIGFINAILSSDISVLLGDFYQPTCAFIVGAWAILPLLGVIDAFGRCLAAFASGGGRR